MPSLCRCHPPEHLTAASDFRPHRKVNGPRAFEINEVHSEGVIEQHAPARLSKGSIIQKASRFVHSAPSRAPNCHNSWFC
jgi:hypothetical protein